MHPCRPPPSSPSLSLLVWCCRVGADDREGPMGLLNRSHLKKTKEEEGQGQGGIESLPKTPETHWSEGEGGPVDVKTPRKGRVSETLPRGNSGRILVSDKRLERRG